MKLYTYFRSSAAYRLRIALALKGLDVEAVFVHLGKAKHKSDDYAALNPQTLIPSLETQGEILTQSLAIMEYLEETHPQTPLLPSEPIARAKVRAICGLIACDTHPLNNLRVLGYLTNTLGVSDEQKQAWYAHWIHTNFDALEKILQNSSSRYCYGDTPTLADCCLVPQVYNAQRYNVDLSAYPTIVQIAQNCNQLSAFISAMPQNQPDYDL